MFPDGHLGPFFGAKVVRAGGVSLTVFLTGGCPAAGEAEIAAAVDVPDGGVLPPGLGLDFALTDIPEKRLMNVSRSASLSI